MAAHRLSSVRLPGPDRLTLDVTDAGPDGGDPVVLLHGFPQDRTAWSQLEPLLHAGGLRTIAVDQRGYSPGARPPGRRPYRLQALVSDVVAVLDAAQLPAAHPVGHDWGAVVGWATAATAPSRVRTLTALSVPHPRAYLQAMVTGGQLARSWYAAAFQLPLLPETLLLADGGRRLRGALRAGGLPGPLATRYVDRMLEPGALSAALGWYRAAPWTDLRIPPLTVPTLHAWGPQDATLDAAGAQACGRFVRARYRFVLVEGSGHWLPETAADRLAPVLLDHVTR